MSIIWEKNSISELDNSMKEDLLGSGNLPSSLSPQEITKTSLPIYLGW